jgi:histidinol-phosphate aminotransferase
MATGPVNQGIAGLKPYQPGKPIDEVARELGLSDIVKLASNENPLGVSEGVTRALQDAIPDLSLYPDGSGYRLKRGLAQHLGVQTSQITLGNGSNDVLEIAARVMLEPEGEAIVSEHAFIVYYLAVTAIGAKLTTVPAVNYGADLQAMLDAVTEQTRVVFLANPNNPTGTWVDEAALTDFLDALPQRVWVVLDEAYFEYVEEPTYPDGLRLLVRYPNLLVTRTFSKIYGLAGLRIGYGIASAELSDLMNRARQPFNVNHLALTAAEAALGDQEYLQNSRSNNRAGMAQLTSGLTELGLEYIPSVGNFVTFSLANQAVGVADVNRRLLESGVIVRPVAEYGLADHLRVSIGREIENDRFLSALGHILKS